MSQNFGIRVRNELWKRGMKASELAKQLEISDAYLSDILSGKRDAKEQKRRIRYILSLDGDDDESGQ